MALAAEDKSFLMKEGVYEHLGKIINRVIAEKPVDGHGMIEVLSRLVKDPAAQVKVEFTDQDVAAFAEQVKKAQLLDKAPAEEGEELAAGAVPNVVEEAEMFAWAGVGLGEQESYKVMCSLRNMAVKNKDKYSQIRLWGKILGTSADYWVAEATTDAPDEAETEDMDKPGEPGVNQFAYFITTDLAGKWEQLPHIKPQEIVAAKLIRRIFTGVPNAKVVTHPFFNGTERVMLRAQIARISADTVLCPKGKLWRGEDPDLSDPANIPAVEVNAEFVVPLPSKLLGKETWTHMVPYIRKDGKTASPVKPDDPADDEDAEGKAAMAAYNEQVEDDPSQDSIRALTEDGMEWVVKQAGDTALYRDPLDTTKTRSNAVAFVRSLGWPGAVTVSSKGYFSNLYIGYALKAGDPDFFPAAPPDVQDEPVDLGEQPEPQGELAQEGEPGEGEEQG